MNIRELLKNIIGYFLFYSGIIHVVRFFGSRQRKVILYHSIDDTDNIFSLNTGLRCSTRNFLQHMQYLKKYYHPISLEEMVRATKRENIPPAAISITFDDGFSDNYTKAYPILSEYKLPFTIFLTTNSIGNEESIWLEELNYFINKVGTKKVIASLKKTTADNPIADSDFSKETDVKTREALQHYFSFKLNSKQREIYLEKIKADTALDPKEVVKEIQLYLSWNQIHDMSTEIASFGNHGANHEPFSTLSLDELKADIFNSLNSIKKNIKQTFMPFAYPFGQEVHFNNSTTDFILRSGHDSIFTTIPESPGQNSNPNVVGRISVKNWSKSRFAFELEKETIRYFFKAPKLNNLGFFWSIR